MKIKKLVALLTAGVLCLGMSTTAFAAQSVQDADGAALVKGADGYVSGYGELTPAQQEAFDKAKEVLEDEKQVDKILQDLGYNTNGVDVIVMGMGDYRYYDKDGNPADLPKGTTLQFSLEGLDKAKGLKNGDKVYLMHYKADGTWEVVNGTVVTLNGFLYVETDELDSLSPIAFLKVMSDGKVVALDKKGEVVKTTTTKVSPKTGE